MGDEAVQEAKVAVREILNFCDASVGPVISAGCSQAAIAEVCKQHTWYKAEDRSVQPWAGYCHGLGLGQPQEK